jgi:CubicO group peptidase (beta-lactamase class C family)
MKNNLTALFLVIISLVSYQLCTAQIDSKKFHKNLESLSKKSILPGFSVTIIKNDSVYFQNGYGFADKILKKKYTIETIQPIASISKTFIGFSIMKGIDLGYFTLETDINTLLPFKISNPNFPNSVITIKDLVTHTSSLIDNEATYMSLYSLGEKPSMELSNFLKEYYTSDGKFYSTSNFGTIEPRKEYNYSNIASSLASYIIEIKSGISFEQFTKDIFLNL